MEKVRFQPLSARQKRDCINRNAQYQCPNEAVLEAVYGRQKVRCCLEEGCKTRAAELARISEEAFGE